MRSMVDQRGAVSDEATGSHTADFILVCFVKITLCPSGDGAKGHFTQAGTLQQNNTQDCVSLSVFLHSGG